MRKKKKWKISILLCIIFWVLAVIGGLCTYMAYQRILQLQQKQGELETELENASCTIYVAETDIAPGEACVIGENVVEKEVLFGLPREMLFTEKMSGMIARTGMKSGSPILVHDVMQNVISNDAREYEIGAVHLMTDQKEFDTVDVRILFPDGSDFLVLSKKKIENLHLEENLFRTVCTEEEILRFSSAILDAYLNTGTYLYTTRYLEENLQKEAIPDYPMCNAAMLRIKDDPNILSVATECLNIQARLDLYNRLALMGEEQLEAVGEGHELVDTAKTSIWTQEMEKMNAENASFDEAIEDNAIENDIEEAVPENSAMSETKQSEQTDVETERREETEHAALLDKLGKKQETEQEETR